MADDLGRRIRQLTATAPVSVPDALQRAERSRPVPPGRKVKVSLAVLAAVAIVAGIVFVATGHHTAPTQRVQVAQGPTPSLCSPVDTTPTAEAGAPVIRSSSVVFAPAGSRMAGGEVTIGLNTTEDGVVLSIRRQPAAGPHGATYQLDYYEGDNALGGTSTVPFKTMQAGDPIQAEIAIRNTDPKLGTTGPGGIQEMSSIAWRLVDLRTRQTVQSTPTPLLRGSPAPPTKAATSTGSDLSVTEATWGSGWKAVTVGLGDQAIKQPPADDDALVGIAHKASAFVVVDAAHPKGLPVGTAALHARTGDRVTLQARTATAGTHTAVAITDQRTGACVTTPG